MKLYFREVGSGLPLLILHGLYGMSDNWMNIARILSQKYRVIVPDLRNHGRSPFTEEHTYDSMVSDIHNLVAGLSIDKFILIGHSMGGKVAMKYALSYSGSIERLIIVDIAPKNYGLQANMGEPTTNHRFIMDALAGLKIETCSSRKEIDSLLSEHISIPSLRDFLLKNIRRNSKGAFYWSINLGVLSKALDELLDGFSGETRNSTVLTMFIKGENSNYILADDAFYIRKFFTQSILVNIKNAGHWVHAEQPELFYNTIEFFLDK